MSHHPSPAHGVALPPVGVYTVGHDGVLLPQAVLYHGSPSTAGGPGAAPLPTGSPQILRQVRLDIQPLLLRQTAQRRHQLIGAAGGEAGGVRMGLTWSK